MKGKLFWICGASSGIGYAVAETLAEQSASLIIMSRNEEQLNECAKELKAKGASEVFVAALDIADKSTPEKAKKIVGSKTLSGFLLNSGGPKHGALLESTREDFDHANQLVLSGPASLLLTLLPYFSNNSSIVAITSTTVRQPTPGLSLSAAYRAGLVAWLKALSDEVAPRGIRVNSIAPGYTDTERLQTLVEAVSKNTGKSASQVRDDWAKTTPLNRIASPREIANASLFLFSENASYITGQTLAVDGGRIRGY